MTKCKFLLKNVATVVACFAVTTMDTGNHSINGASSKNHTSRRNFLLMALFALLAVFSGCKKDNDDKTNGATVTEVLVSPSTPNVAKGGTQQFSVTVSGENDPAQTVTWTIAEAGKHANTAINAVGLLTVATDESLTTITVKATSTVDKTKSGTATVTVFAQDELPTVTDVTVTPSTVNVAKGGTQQFSVTVSGNNNPAQTVTWAISEAGKHANTTVSAAGLLTVASDESLTTITVMATSTVDNTKNGTATVTVTQNGDNPAEITWTTVTNSGFGTGLSKALDIACGNNMFVAVGMEKKISTSADGVSWTLLNPTGIPSSFHNWIYYIAYGNGKFVIYDYEGRAAVAEQTNLSNWTTDDSYQFGTEKLINGLTFCNDKFFAYLNGQIKYSTDGANWTYATWSGSDPFSVNTSSGISSITWDGSKYVAVGTQFVSPSTNCIIATSTDGETWTAPATQPFTAAYTIRLVWDRAKFVAVMLEGVQGRVVHSSDGVNWSLYNNLSYDNPSSAIQSNFIFAGGKYVLCGLEGSVSSSNDGKAWLTKKVSGFTSTYFIKLAYGNKKFLALAFDGSLAYSNEQE